RGTIQEGLGARGCNSNRVTFRAIGVCRPAALFFVSRIAPAISPTRFEDRKMPRLIVVNSNARKEQPPWTSNPNGYKNDNRPVGITLVRDTTQHLNVCLQSQTFWSALPVGFIVFDTTSFPRWSFA